MSRSNKITTVFILSILILSSITIVVQGGVVEDKNCKKSTNHNSLITYKSKLLCCFPAGTKITMADKTKKNIEDIKIGEKVLSYDVEQKRFITSTVTKTIIKNREGVYNINDGLICPTNDHPLYVIKPDGRSGWAAINPKESKVSYTNRNAMQLEIGDKLFTENKSFIEIKSICYNPNIKIVYTFSVNSYAHDYFANNILVSNQARCRDEIEIRHDELYPENPRLLITYPTNPSPENGATDVELNPNLRASFSNPYGLKMNVIFCNAVNDEVIGIHKDVDNGITTSVTWSGLDYDTEYNWYAIAFSYIYSRYIPKGYVIDLKNFNKIPIKDIWSFTTKKFETNQKPTIDTLNPSNGETVSETIQIKGTANDPDGTITQVEYKIDNEDWNTATGTNDWETQWDTTTINDGQHTIHTRSKDNQNQYSETDTTTITVKNNQEQNQPPTIEITEPTNGETISETIQIKGTANDPDGTITQVEYKIDNEDWNTATGTNDWETQWDTTTINDGQHTIHTRSKDNQNQYSETDTTTITVKNNQKQNQPPNKPKDPTPEDGAENIQINPKLSVNVSDPEKDKMNVTFYDASNDQVISTKTSISSENQVNVTWENLDYDTEYSWYVIVEDTKGETNKSNTWSFTTKSKSDLSIKINTIAFGRVKAKISNNDENTLSNVNWSIKVEGGIFKRIDVLKEGEIKEIRSGKTEKISTWDIWDLKSRIHGLGRIRVSIDVNVDEEIIKEEANGFVIWRIVLVFHRN